MSYPSQANHNDNDDMTNFSITIKKHDTQHNGTQYCYDECHLSKISSLCCMSLCWMSSCIAEKRLLHGSPKSTTGNENGSEICCSMLRPAASVVNNFTAVNYGCSKKNYPITKAVPFQVLRLWVVSYYYPQKIRLDRDKLSSLFWKLVNYGHKKYHIIEP